MFSGIIENLAIVTFLNNKEDKTLKLGLKLPPTFFSTLKEGASLSVNGVCLTFLLVEKESAFFDVSLETKKKTNLKHLKLGDKVNIERALKLGDEVGGHLLSGHILQTIPFLGCKEEEYFFGMDKKTAPFIVEKGFVALNGTSLTIAQVFKEKFSVAMIPHTLKKTNLANLNLGQKVNLEVDFITQLIVNTVQNHLHNISIASP